MAEDKVEVIISNNIDLAVKTLLNENLITEKDLNNIMKDIIVHNTTNVCFCEEFNFCDLKDDNSVLLSSEDSYINLDELLTLIQHFLYKKLNKKTFTFKLNEAEVADAKKFFDITKQNVKLINKITELLKVSFEKSKDNYYKLTFVKNKVS